jgi:hypothetical protein
MIGKYSIIHMLSVRTAIENVLRNGKYTKLAVLMADSSNAVGFVFITICKPMRK